MKKILLLLSCIPTFVIAQTTAIPDANFEQKLVSLGLDNTVNGSVLTANINTVTDLDVSSSSISNLTGIGAFTALVNLDCSNNSLSSLNITQNLNLEGLDAYNNPLGSINTSQNTDLIFLGVENTNLTSLDVSQNTNLEELLCSFNQIQSLNLSLNTALIILYCNDNQLTSLNLKNGNNVNATEGDATNNPNLTCINVDNAAYSTTEWGTDFHPTAVYSENCAALSVDENVQKALSLYPNPTNGMIFISSNEITTINTISVCDVNGRMVKSFTPNNVQSEYEMDLTGITKGLYFITIDAIQGKSTHKIILE